MPLTKSSNRQNQPVLLEAGRGFPFGGLVTGRGHEKGFLDLGMLCFLVWVLLHVCINFVKFTEPYTYDLYVFMYVTIQLSFFKNLSLDSLEFSIVFI